MNNKFNRTIELLKDYININNIVITEHKKELKIEYNKQTSLIADMNRIVFLKTKISECLKDIDELNQVIELLKKQE